MLSQQVHNVFDEVQGLRGAAESADMDLVDLTDFDVQIALTKDEGVELYEVMNIVTRFMIESFRSCLDNDGSSARFDTVILLERSRRLAIAELDRELQDEPDDSSRVIVGELFTAEFKGATLFSRSSDQDPVSPLLVEYCQRQAFLQDDMLLDQLQSSSAVGLGDSVVDVRAFINTNSNTETSESTDGSFEIVIIIAIVIACVAFLFLVFAILWAWRYDKKNRDAYLANKAASVEDRTFEGSPASKAKAKSFNKVEDEIHIPSYPSVIGGESVADGGVYPESVISEDINSSLTQYYHSGLQNYTTKGNRLQDAGSVSSMESYGYSLDGYAPSLATHMPDGASTAMSVGPGVSTTGTNVAKESRKKESRKIEP